MLGPREVQKRFIADMRSRGVHPWDCAPPLFRFLWANGIQVLPPHFLSFRACAWLAGGWFGLLFGILIGTFVWAVHLSPWLGPVAGLLGGLLFGLQMAAHFRKESGRLNLPPWNQYVQQLPPANPLGDDL